MKKIELTDGLWIGGFEDKVDVNTPTYLFKKVVEVQRNVKSAWVCASSLGCFTLAFNQCYVSDEYFAPGYSQYNKRVLYKKYDVTSHLRCGENSIIAEVANGWYAGRLGLVLQNNCFGDRRAFRMQLYLAYEDGSEEIIETDGSWLVSTEGPRRKAEFFDGEEYDARILTDQIAYESVTTFGSLSEAMNMGKTGSGSQPALEEFDGTPVTLHERVSPKKITQISDDTILMDFGVNSAKIVAFMDIDLEDGTELIIRHGEVLNRDGRLYTNNLRSAKAQIRYIAKEGKQSYCPKFTYMGFRYAEIQVKKAAMSKKLMKEITWQENLVAYEIYSDMKRTGTFFCSNPLINQLQRNIETSMKSNFVDIPTDCPQRDERSGWTGDIALFISTACFHYDTKSFMNKWLRDLSLAQNEKGIVPHVIPDNGLSLGKGKDFVTKIMRLGAAVWGDVAVLVPWQEYMATGDVTILEKQYESMKKWVSYEIKASKRFSVGKNRYIWDKSFQYGDWLAPGEGLLANIRKGKWTATAYMANSVYIMGKVAEILGKEEDACFYEKQFQNIKLAFRKAFLDANGHIKNGFQSIWVLAVWFHLLEKEEIRYAVDDLVLDIEKRNYHLSTGFVGTPFICFVLSDYGYADIAYKLLLQETSPGWLYQIKCGATSIWERWDALREDGTVKDGDDVETNMVSFNHYAYGAIGDWLYKRVAGLEALEPGYKCFMIHPIVGGGLTHAKLSYICPYGEIVSKWEIVEGQFRLFLQVPDGTNARVVLPSGKVELVNEGKYKFTERIDWRE